MFNHLSCINFILQYLVSLQSNNTCFYLLPHRSYVILIAFSLQQWLHERASTLRYTYIACLLLLNLVVHKVHKGVIIVNLLYSHASTCGLNAFEGKADVTSNLFCRICC